MFKCTKFRNWDRPCSKPEPQETARNRWKPPDTAGPGTIWTTMGRNWDRPGSKPEPPETAGNRRKPPETAGHDLNWTNVTWIWGRPAQNQNRRKPPETAGNRRATCNLDHFRHKKHIKPMKILLQTSKSGPTLNLRKPPETAGSGNFGPLQVGSDADIVQHRNH